MKTKEMQHITLDIGLKVRYATFTKLYTLYTLATAVRPLAGLVYNTTASHPYAYSIMKHTTR